MKVLISFRGDLLALGLAEQFRQHPGFSVVEVADTTEKILAAIRQELFDVHLVGSSCIPTALEVARTITREALAVYVPGELVLCAIDPDALMVLDARRIGFERVVGATSDLPERLLAPRGSALWLEDSVNEFSLGPVGSVTLADICHDDVDRRIITMVANGDSDAEIAEILHYGVQSVRNRVSKLLHRSGFRNRTELAVKMVRRSQRA